MTKPLSQPRGEPVIAPPRMPGLAPRTRSAPMLAALPLHDLPELREATDAFWQAVACELQSHGVPAPLTLTRGAAPAETGWTDPALLLSQIGGYPLMTGYSDRLTVVGAPWRRAGGCEGPFHRAAVVVRAGSRASGLGDVRGLRCALDDPQSDTGMNLLRTEVSMVAGGEAFFRGVVPTGSPLASLEAVAEGRAEVAAIDALSYALAQRHRPALTRAVKLLLWTVRTPGPAFVTRRGQADWILVALQASLAKAMTDPALRAARQALMLGGFSALRPSHYRSVLHLAQIAADNGYPALI